jgi:hypothetical protein
MKLYPCLSETIKLIFYIVFFSLIYGCGRGGNNSTIDNAALDSISIEPDITTIPVGENYPFQLSAQYTDGTNKYVTDQMTWSLQEG